MKSNPVLRWTSLALLGCICAGATARADDDKAEKAATDERKAEIKVIAIASAGKHWIGIHAVPIKDEALKTHLALKGDRLIVVQVVPDSPAAKAGLKQHDVLVRFGDQELNSLEDLVKAVEENGEKEGKLTVFRGGKEMSISIHPAKRPEDKELGIRQVLPQDLRVYVDGNDKGDGKGKYTLRMIGPGIAAARAYSFAQGASAFPDGLSLSVTKENNQPAKIVAKKDGKTYETTGDKLNELPVDIRPLVERLLHGPHAMAFSLEDMKKLDFDRTKIHEEVHKAVEAAKKHAAEAQGLHGDAKELRSRIEVRRTDASALDSLRKEIDTLKSEVEKLKENKGEATKDATPKKD